MILLAQSHRLTLLWLVSTSSKIHRWGVRSGEIQPVIKQGSPPRKPFVWRRRQRRSSGKLLCFTFQNLCGSVGWLGFGLHHSKGIFNYNQDRRKYNNAGTGFYIYIKSVSVLTSQVYGLRFTCVTMLHVYILVIGNNDKDRKGYKR